MSSTGYALILLAYFAWAVSGLLLKKVLVDQSALLVTAIAASFGTLVLLPILYLQRAELATISRTGWALIIGAGILWISVGELAYTMGLDRIDLSLAGLLGLSFPIFATVLSFFFLEEPISWKFIIGSILMAVGFLIAV